MFFPTLCPREAQYRSALVAISPGTSILSPEVKSALTKILYPEVDQSSRGPPKE